MSESKPKCPECERHRGHDTIWFHSGVNKDLKPFVHIAWGGEWTQFDPEGLRDHAHNLLAAAEAADSDAIFLRFMVDKIGIKLEQLGGVLLDLRGYREKLR